MVLKNIIRETLIFFHLDLSKNLKYDRLTKKIIKQFLKKDSNCIDIGCHKGEILDLMLKYAPSGKHWGFEPIPYLFNKLKQKYTEKASILPYALSENKGTSNFQLVKNAPAYSGIKKRRYDIQNPDIEEIKVELEALDNLIDKQDKINFVKIDVEGAEFGVFKGAEETFKRSKPIILFECGKGASDYYGTNPKELFHFIKTNIGLNIYTLDAFLKRSEALSENQFNELFETNQEYYFVAAS